MGTVPRLARKGSCVPGHSPHEVWKQPCLGTHEPWPKKEVGLLYFHFILCATQLMSPPHPKKNFHILRLRWEAILRLATVLALAQWKHGAVLCGREITREIQAHTETAYCATTAMNNVISWCYSSLIWSSFKLTWLRYFTSLMDQYIRHWKALFFQDLVRLTFKRVCLLTLIVS